MSEPAQDQGFTPKLESLFDMTKMYCYHHINFPSSSKDGQLPQSIKDRLMQAATRETAHQLASTGTTRYYLMTKVVLEWFIKHVFKATLFAGLDPEADGVIVSLKDTIFQGM
jgi:hypothetical protein